jgi:uncharacterized membrane protein
MDAANAKLLRSIALVFEGVLVSTSIVRLTCSDVNLLLVLFNTALGVLWFGAGI